MQLSTVVSAGRARHADDVVPSCMINIDGHANLVPSCMINSETAPGMSSRADDPRTTNG